ncbi:hypothetical protein MNEG_14061 [Monoraphidium neglectum]|uniref:Uncharacterized protein n=1 Tax=Monoraphidium neglectum TaxID=145388 RepID=A0A0D2LWG6_9CHLO|nr:hypothetical protein MNEG_14061 [Monoraphidium neglectum]KIY93901.1 hypothetical protein MNEG_14061 [Monoraphidium neglectum]|eukprot:XP_013892921.1 hypothetical protein MNEG_14061 [Monoraphidium neglectum]
MHFADAGRDAEGSSGPGSSDEEDGSQSSRWARGGQGQDQGDSRDAAGAGSSLGARDGGCIGSDMVGSCSGTSSDEEDSSDGSEEGDRDAALPLPEAASAAVSRPTAPTGVRLDRSSCRLSAAQRAGLRARLAAGVPVGGIKVHKAP